MADVAAFWPGKQPGNIQPSEYVHLLKLVKCVRAPSLKNLTIAFLNTPMNVLQIHSYEISPKCVKQLYFFFMEKPVGFNVLYCILHAICKTTTKSVTNILPGLWDMVSELQQK